MSSQPPSLSGQSDLSRIDAGVRAGIISPDQATALRKLPLDSPAQQFSAVRASDEPFALFRGFRDVFLALGIVVLATGLAGIAAEVFGLQFDLDIGWDDVGLALGLAAIAWGVAEWVTARLRMPLASLVTALSFCAALGGAAILSLYLFGVLESAGLFGNEFSSAAFGLCAAGAGLLFYLRFRLPFAMLIIAGGLTITVYSLLEAMVGGNGNTSFRLYAFLCGLLIFAAALSYELRDPAREKRQSENAFWLHLLAAPLLVFALTGGQNALDIGDAAGMAQVFVVVAVLGLIALMIDRRAFIVAALLYFAGAIAFAINQSGMPANVQFAATAVLVGLFVVGLALGWQPIRRGFLKLLPEGLSSRLPNPAGPDALGG